MFFLGNQVLYHPQIHLDSIWSCKGQINTCLPHQPSRICPMQFCVLGWNTLQKWKKSFHRMTSPAILPKDTNQCVGQLLSVQGFCMPFRQLACQFWNRTPYCCFKGSVFSGVHWPKRGTFIHPRERRYEHRLDNVQHVLLHTQFQLHIRHKVVFYKRTTKMLLKWVSQS